MWKKDAGALTIYYDKWATFENVTSLDITYAPTPFVAPFVATMSLLEIR